MSKLLNKTNTIVFIGLLTLYRVYVNATLGLHHDETYYWLWSRHLDLSYYDHPAMVAWFIKATTLFSQGEFWVRFSGILTALALSYLIWKLVMQMSGNEEAAAGSVITLNILPLTMSGALIITPDVPSFLFWGLAVYFAWQVFSGGKTYNWYLFGASFGLSFFSKYTTALLLPCLFLFMILTEERKWFRSPHPYLACLLASVFFLPVLIWNAGQDWVSFRFQLGHGLGGQTYSIWKVFEYIGGQMLVAGPFAWIAGMWAVTVFLFRKNKASLFLSLTSLPVILFFGYTSLKNAAGPNWPAPAYFTFSAALSLYLLGFSRIKRVIWVLVALATFGLSMLAIAHARFGIVPVQKIYGNWAETDATNWFYGWKELACALTKYKDVDFIITPSHQLSSEIEYYMKESVPVHIDTYDTRFSQYNLWPSPVKHGAKMLYVSLKGESLNSYKAYIHSPDSIDYLTVTRPGRAVRTYRIVYGTCDFR